MSPVPWNGSSCRSAGPLRRSPQAISGSSRCFPFFGIIAIIVSMVALRTLKRNPNLHGRGRAWFGLAMGIITTLVYLDPHRIGSDRRSTTWPMVDVPF